MELTTSEQKILENSHKFSKQGLNKHSNSNFGWLWLFVGILGGSMLIIYGILQIMGIIPNEHDALRAISEGLLMIGFLCAIYDNFKFKSASHSLIRKLAEEQKKTHPH